jgi:AraC-like DNA-binding protein
MSDETYKEIEALAAKQHIKPAVLMRQLIEKGLSLEKTKDDVDFIRKQIREELDDVMLSYMERLIKLQVKMGTMSVAAAMASTRLLSKVQMASGLTYHELLEDIKKDAAGYIQVKTEMMDYAIHRMEEEHGAYTDLE